MSKRIRQRQRPSRKLILISSISLITLCSIGFIVYFNLSNVKLIQAQKEQPVNFIVVPDQEYVNDFSIAAPIVKTMPAPTSKAILVRKVKPQSENTLSLEVGR